MPTQSTILNNIPTRIQRIISVNLRRVALFNAEVYRMRDLESRLGQPGRYEYEYRLTNEDAARESVAELAMMRELPAGRLVDWAAAYAALGHTDEVVLEPRSAAAESWK